MRHIISWLLSGRSGLEVGTRLKDGKKRVFEYFSEVN